MPQWVTRQGSSISTEPCGELRAVHLDANGMTHLVDPVSAEVLLFLASGPHTQDALRSFVANLVGDRDLTWPEVEVSWLQPLADAGMIEAVS